MKPFQNANRIPGVSLILVIGLLAVTPVFSLSFFDDGCPRELAAKLEAAMTDEQALAQIFMFGWVGQDPSPLIMDWIRQRNLGGVKIFGWNTDDTIRLAKTVGELQSASLAGPFNIPLLVATDQEGGWIRHVKGLTSETPGNMAIGASGYPRDSFLSGYHIGREIALIGVNMNFAPTVDLFTNRDSTVIGPRSFGADPVRAGIFGQAFARGQLAAGVIPTAKHFPGHGDTALDSHGILPFIRVPLETLWERELIPYRMMIAQGVPAIMSAHLAFPLTGGGDTPASLSSWFLRDLLRDKMGFEGVIVTDDMNMIGATSYLRVMHRTVLQSIEAGNDIIMFSHTPALNDIIWTHVYNTMRTNESLRETVRQSARRVIYLKLTHLRGENAVPFVPDTARIEAEIPTPEASAFFLDLAGRSVTFIKPSDPSQSFPLTPERAGRVLLAGRFFTLFDDFFNFGRIAFPGAAVFRFSSATSPSALIAAALNADTIIFNLSDHFDLLMLNHLRRLNRQIYVFSILSPVHIERVPWVTGALAVYSYAPESFAAGFSALIGRIPALGILPYEL